MKFEDSFEILTNPAPVVVVDFHVYLHNVKNWFENKIEGSFSSEVEDRLIKGCWALKIQRGPDMLPRFPHRIVIVADSRFKDIDNYWRDKYMRESPVVQKAWENYAESKGKDLSEIPTHYKGTRKEKDATFWRVFNIGWEYANRYYQVFHHEGYEADDTVGSIYRISRDGIGGNVAHERQILLSSVDRDWTQCVADEHKVYFANTRYPGPKEKIQSRLVNNAGVIEHTKWKMGYDLDHPKNLADWKVEFGDDGDNLPAGSPKCLFDLTEPNPEYNVEKDAPWYDDLVKDLNNPEPNDRPDHFESAYRAFVNVCIEPPVSKERV
jgi:hypothetical protein